MALLKNLYLDLSFLNPFRNLNANKKSLQQDQQSNHEVKSAINQRAQANVHKTLSNQQISQQHVKHMHVHSQVLAGTYKRSELPSPPRKLIDTRAQSSTLVSNQKLELPKVRAEVAQPPRLEEENNVTISNVHKQGKESSDGGPVSQVLETSTPVSESFFEGLKEHVSKEDEFIRSGMPKQLLYSNLMKEMRDYWQNQKQDLHQTVIDNAMKADMAARITELHNLEIEWQRLQLEHEKIGDELASRELIIENHVRQLKKSFKRLHLNVHTPMDKNFVLADGHRIRSLQELIDCLKTMDESIFGHHVTNGRNDFANWIEGVMMLPDLARDIHNAKNRHQMIVELENWHNSA